MKRIFHYLKHLLIGVPIALDEVGNVILFEGNPKITISAHCGSQLVAKKPCLFCRIVCSIFGYFFPFHCERAWRAERKVFEDSKDLPGG